MARECLDCVIVGFYERNYDDEIATARDARDSSGFYRYLQWQLPWFNGRRVPIMDLLNHSLREATGRDYRLNMADLPNLGAIVLKSFLCRRGMQAEIVNFFNKETDRLAALLADAPRAVAITTTYYEEPDPIIPMVRFIRRHNPETKIILGGPFVFDMCFLHDLEGQDRVFREIGADIYIHDSQGELTLSRVLAELRKPAAQQDLAGVANLVYTSDNRTFHRTGRSVEDNSLDDNAVDWQHFDPSYYTPTTPMRTARSCAYSCAFCSYPYFAGPLNLSSIAVVERELQALKAAGVKNLMFIDDTFNVPLPRFKDLLRMMIRNRFDFAWYSYFRCSNADDETFDLMRESGCAGVFLGLESGDPSLLRNMNKHASVEKYRAGVGKLKQRGIPTFVSMIVGFPGETKASVERSIEFLNDTAPTFFRVEMYYHRRSLPVHKDAERYGLHGEDLSWTHNTMDWRGAVDMVEMMYRNVVSSAILPVYTFDFWALPYLTGKGFALKQIVDFTKIASDLLVRGFDDGAPDSTGHERRLISLFRENAPPALAM
jgi:radical SAM PhpK family P-methyltransferase